MPDKETGVKWWFKNVIVPLLGGGGVIAIVVAGMIQHSKSSDQPQIQSPSDKPKNQPRGDSPEDDHTQPKASLYTFTVTIPEPQPEFLRPQGMTTLFDLNLYVDDILAGKIHTDGTDSHRGAICHVSQLGKHKYNIMGTLVTKSNYGFGIYAAATIMGQGEIYLQDGSEFSLEPDHKATMRGSKLIWLLRRTN